MGDSDDEYDRKRRDKFRGERSAGGESYRSDRRGGPGGGVNNDDRPPRRDDWADRGRGGRPDYRDYRGRDRFSPERGGPPPKRMRQEWGEDGRPRYGHDMYGGYGGGWGHDHFGMHPGGGHLFGGGGLHGRLGHPANDTPANSDLQTQPPMLTLKQFLATQDDAISDADAIAKYNDYKLEFKRQQLNEFFVAHKDEEWFKIKYHPEESRKRKEEQLQFLKNRACVFNELLDGDVITSVSVDTFATEKLLRLLDTVVIKLEGGTDEDLKALDEPERPPPQPAAVVPITNPTPMSLATLSPPRKAFQPNVIYNTVPEKDDDEEDWDDDVICTDNDAEKPADDVEEKNDDGEEKNDEIKADDGLEGNGENDDDDAIKDDDEKTNLGKKRKRSHSESSSSSSSSDESDQEGDKTNNDQSLDKNGDEKEKVDEIIEDNKELVDKMDVENEIDEKIPTLSDDAKSPMLVDDGKSEMNQDVDDAKSVTDKKEADEDDDKTETIDLDKDDKPTPRALHRTCSIFLRNLAPTITKAEVETMCKKFNGFLRVAIADPLIERRWFRRGWVTFQRDVNIKEFCWSLNNVRLRDCELGAIVNRDLSRRVRPVNGITAHKSIVRSDIKLCAKITLNLDAKANLWTTSSENTEDNEDGKSTQNFGFNSANPVLQNITDYLIEEASAEEDELLGLSGAESKDAEGESLERDVQLISVLDKIILYLRIVHSVDFYNHCEYPYEDEMPNRCGIIHARGPPPQSKVTSTEIQDYNRNFETKMSSFLSKSQPIEKDELVKMGCKDTDAEVEKFIQANTQELAKDKWLCPLSGKKFKGPEFIRKHIFNKHGEKVDEVTKEVEFFNNYLMDPKRPQLPEHPGNNRKAPVDINPHPAAGYRPVYPGPGGFGIPYGGYGPPMIAPIRQRGGFGGGRRPGGEYRPIIHYRDLDAPREPDEFL